MRSFERHSPRTATLVALRAACAAACLALSAAATAQTDTAGGAFAPVTAERLLHPAPGDWQSYRRTYDVTGFSPLTEIDRETVRNLRPVWAYPITDTSRWVATPIVANGLMYVAQGSGRVLALEVETGELVWTQSRTFADDIYSSEAYPRHRGVAIYGNVVYWGTADSFLVALDAETGRKLWAGPHAGGAGPPDTRSGSAGRLASRRSRG
jgi:glucose dehydrogenase